MAKKLAAPTAPVEAKVVVVPVVLSPTLAALGTEKIDVRPEFVDFKIAQLTDAELVDQLGMIKKAGKDLEKWEKLAVTVCKSRMAEPSKDQPSVEMAGQKYNAIRTAPNRHAVSLDKLKAKFGEAALKDCYGDTPTDTLNVKPLE